MRFVPIWPSLALEGEEPSIYLEPESDGDRAKLERMISLGWVRHYGRNPLNEIIHATIYLSVKTEDSSAEDERCDFCDGHGRAMIDFSGNAKPCPECGGNGRK